jgi:hypothetical protein
MHHDHAMHTVMHDACGQLLTHDISETKLLLAERITRKDIVLTHGTTDRKLQFQRNLYY